MCLCQKVVLSWLSCSAFKAQILMLERTKASREAIASEIVSQQRRAPNWVPAVALPYEYSMNRQFYRGIVKLNGKLFVDHLLQVAQIELSFLRLNGNYVAIEIFKLLFSQSNLLAQLL